LPVKVWLYGGGNQAGGISNPTYDGCTASEKVIQVSIGYRVGPLGFLALDSLALQGNQGIQDQLLGLQWVQENIEAFGGDSKKVLLFGQSAGAADTFIISSLPQAPSLISAAIMQSGSGSKLQTTSDVQNATEAFVKALGCGLDDIACVRAVSVSAINSSSAASGASSPDIIVDGTIIPTQPLEAGVKVPALAGSTTDEGTLFILSQYQTSVLTLNSTDYDGFLTTRFGPLAQKVNETYSLSNYTGIPGGPVLAAMSAVMTHAQFRCPTRRFVRKASQDGVPVWTYSFNHTLSCPWYNSIPSFALDLLASTHTAEIPFVFNGTTNMPKPNGTCSLSAGEVSLAAKMLGAWDSMAANANPGSDWPQYDTSSSAGVNVVGDDFTIGTVDYSMCDFWDEVQAATANGTSSGGANGTSSGTEPTQTSVAAWPWFKGSVSSLAAIAGLILVPLWAL
jgi:carboxylesterase type B